MTKIIVEDLGQDLASALTEFMRASSPTGAVDIHGTSVDVNGLTNKKIKFLLHKFLHTKGLNEFGVLDTAGVFEVIHLKPEEKREQKHENLKATMPHPPITSQYSGPTSQRAPDETLGSHRASGQTYSREEGSREEWRLSNASIRYRLRYRLSST